MNIKTKLLAAALACGLLTASAQTNTVPAFYQTLTSYFLTHNVNLTNTFAQPGSIWTGVDSIQGGNVPLTDTFGLSYRLYGVLNAESQTRTSGVAGTLVSQSVGLSLNFVVIDTRLTLYGVAGYDLWDGQDTSRLFKDRIFGEAGVRVQKALTDNTWAGVGLGVQIPANRQIFSVMAGVSF